MENKDNVTLFCLSAKLAIYQCDYENKMQLNYFVIERDVCK